MHRLLYDVNTAPILLLINKVCKVDKAGKQIDSLSRRVIKIVGISSIIILLILLVIKGFKVLLLILAGLLFSIFFRGIALQLRNWFPIGETMSVIVSFLFVVAIIIAGFTMASPRVASQMDKLRKEMPQAVEHAKKQIKGTAVGDFVINRISGLSQGKMNFKAKIFSFFSSVFGVIGDLYIIFFLGMFFMAQPKVYRKSIVCLFPPQNRERTEEILLTVAYNLKRWLLGKLLSMLIVGIFTTIGLKIIGIPMALTLGIFAGIITFIPNFGPLLSFIPAGLLALVQGGNTFLYTALLYLGIQALESNLITPYIQKNMISFPMAAILIAQVFLGVFTGALGIILAVPVVCIIVVLVKMLYLEDVLNDKNVQVKGEEKFS